MDASQIPALALLVSLHVKTMEKLKWAGKMAQCVKVLVTVPVGLSLIPGTHMEKAEN